MTMVICIAARYQADSSDKKRDLSDKLKLLFTKKI